MNQHVINIDVLPTGTQVSIDCGLYTHVGILGDRYIDGERTVLAFSAKEGGFVEQKRSDFAADRKIAVGGYPGNLSPCEVMDRARLWRGLPYSLFDRNCEHFVCHAHGLIPKSPQATFLVLLSLFTLVMKIAKV
jgi:hypothetical protein